MFAPVTRIELDTALSVTLQPIRGELDAVRRDIVKLYGEFEKLHGVVDDFREHFATKAAVEAMGRRLVMWVGSLLAVFVAVMGWLVQRAYT